MDIEHARQAVTQLRFHLYSRPLHPELFRIDRSQTIRQRRYQADIWLVGLAHVVTLRSKDTVVTEVAAAPSEVLPERGLVASFKFRGERDEEREFEGGLRYIFSSQVEQMSENVFKACHDDLLADAQQFGQHVTYPELASNGLVPFSYLSVEPRDTELHVHAFHLFP
ncbi:unnamed protein product, partial [marine sediment metagenome]